MLRDIFKTLTEYLQSSEREWFTNSANETEATELSKQNAYREGELCMAEGRYEEAIPHFKKATASKQMKKDALYLLAECYRQVHLLPVARRTYQQLMRLDYYYRDVQDKLKELDVLDTPLSAARPVAQDVTLQMPAEDRYQILETIHEGTYARIYKARDQLLGRVIALKQVNQSYPDRESYLRQMKERLILDHPNILSIYDIHEAQGQIAMEYVEGRNLRSILQVKGHLKLDLLLYIAIQLVNGLHHAHSQGIVHHALTPEHLLLTRQCGLKIIGFRAPDAFMRLLSGADSYSTRYIPPEIWQRQELTVAANIYSFGTILYEMWVGHPPFTRQQLQAYAEHGEPLRYEAARLPPGIAPILDQCLAAQPGERATAIRAIGTQLAQWHKQRKQVSTRAEHLATYKDFLLMALADGALSEEEAAFLSHKRQELQMSEAEARQAEDEVKQELRQLLGENRPQGIVTDDHQ